MDFHLVSFKTCPYVQRSVIALKHKGIAYDITYIDLSDPPAWFQEMSPLGKVPILEVTSDEGDKTVLFESAVLCEFIDEVTGGGLVPADAVQRAQDRAWVAFGAECLMDYYQASMAPDEAQHSAHVEALKGKLTRLQQQVASRPGSLWNGNDLGLVDCAVAPLLMRLQEFGAMAESFDLEAFPELAAWANALDQLPEVAESMVPEWRDLHRQYIVKSGSYIGQASVAA